MHRDTVGAILGGGAGSRMGRRKALVALAGQPLAGHVAAALRGVAHDVAIVGDPEAAQALAARPLTDPPGVPAGPLAGICAALEWAGDAGAAFLLVAPCDTPLLQAAIFEQLRGALDADMRVACAETADGIQPLVSVWGVELADWLKGELAGAHPAVRDVLARAGLARVPFADATLFLNVNTPADLQCAEALLRAG